MNAEIVIVANKWWEVAPFLAVLQHTDATPPTFLIIGHQGESGPAGPRPRLVAQCFGRSLEAWCIQDLTVMDPGESESLTWEKARVLPRILQGKLQPKLVVSLGTAPCPSGSGFNGNVIVGSSVFVHDPYDHPPLPGKHWRHAKLDQVVTSPAEQLLSLVTAEVCAEVGKRLLQPPNAAAAPPKFTAGADLTDLSVVNVTNRDDNVWTDRRALERFSSSTSGLVPASLETTHGVIRLVLDQPFLFVSGLANAVGKYAQEVLQRQYTQNFAAAHNAGVAIAWVVSTLAQHL
jgi:hypothetical protein